MLSCHLRTSILYFLSALIRSFVVLKCRVGGQYRGLTIGLVKHMVCDSQEYIATGRKRITTVLLVHILGGGGSVWSCLILECCPCKRSVQCGVWNVRGCTVTE